MPSHFRRAAELCTVQELALVDAARPTALRAETAERLKGKVARARVLQRKFRDLAARQAREARGKAAPRGRRPARGNARTVAKAELFAEVVERFEARLARLEAAARLEEATQSLSSRAPAAVATRRKRPARKVEPATNAARRRRSAAAAGTRKSNQIESFARDAPAGSSGVAEPARPGGARRATVSAGGHSAGWRARPLSSSGCSSCSRAE